MAAAGAQPRARVSQQELLESLVIHYTLAAVEVEVLAMVVQVPVALAAVEAEVMKWIGAIPVHQIQVVEEAVGVALPTEMKCMAVLAAQELF